MNIIIYDDDKRIWQLCARYIEESGRYSISLSTDNYEEVAAYARQNMKPSLYILDIVIHGFIKGDGFRRDQKRKSYAFRLLSPKRQEKTPSLTGGRKKGLSNRKTLL